MRSCDKCPALHGDTCEINVPETYQESLTPTGCVLHKVEILRMIKAQREAEKMYPHRTQNDGGKTNGASKI